MAGLLCLGLAGCASDDTASAGVDPKCDAAAVEEEIHHIVAESTMQFSGLRSLQCSGNWSYAVAVVETGGDTAPASDTIAPFLFLKVDDILVLKSPQIVCGPMPSGATNGSQDAQVPADLAPLVCP